MNEQEIAKICKALGDENRVKIIKMLTVEELCACKILEEFSITQSTLSHHMKILSDYNLISVRKDGKWSYYSINCKTFSKFKNVISEISCEKNKKSECSCK
jgi:arsenical resistance operon repressor